MADHMTAEQLCAENDELRKALKRSQEAEESALVRGAWNEQQRIAESIASDLRIWAGRKSGTAFEHSAFRVARESEQIRDLAIQRWKSAVAERDALAARLSGMAAVQQWKPIGTAPNDGREVLLYSPQMTFWLPRTFTARWDRLRQVWSVGYGNDAEPNSVTHWSASPEPPHV